MNLYQMTSETRQLFDLMEAGEIDEQTFRDTVAAIGTEEKLESCTQVLKSLRVMMSAHQEEINRHKKAIDSLDKNCERLERAIVEFINAMGEKKVQAGTFQLSVRPYKSTEIYDESQIPAEYITEHPATYTPNKTAIKAAIDSGKQVSGARQIVNQYLHVR